MGRKVNRIGQKFEKLTVIEESTVRLYNRVTWVCRCECGMKKLATSMEFRKSIYNKRRRV